MRSIGLPVTKREKDTQVPSPLPPIFCWTKMGAEAGQRLSDIIRRKELERECGDGLFAWGIGNSVGPAINHAKTAERLNNLETLFTPMKAAPKSIDVAPQSIVMWLGCVTAGGTTDILPQHMLVTSRGHSGSGDEKRGHYALICRSERRLPEQDERNFIDHRAVRNLVSSNPVGASQVTSVVRYRSEESATPTYPVLFRAVLAEQGFVRLSLPVTLSGDLLEKYQAVCAASSPREWLRLTKSLKDAAVSRLPRTQQQPLFALETA